jgi:hypothetical protein
MGYKYKTISLYDFSNTKEGAPLMAGVFEASAFKISKVVDTILNLYSKDGWEFYRNESFSPFYFQNMTSKVLSIGSIGQLPDIPVFIFRKAVSENESTNLNGAIEEKLPDSSVENEDSIVDNPRILEFKKLAKPYIEKLEQIGYKLINQKFSENNCYWEFTYQSNGTSYEFNSIAKLKEYADNF